MCLCPSEDVGQKGMSYSCQGPVTYSLHIECAQFPHEIRAIVLIEQTKQTKGRRSEELSPEVTELVSNPCLGAGTLFFGHRVGGPGSNQAPTNAPRGTSTSEAVSMKEERS